MTVTEAETVPRDMAVIVPPNIFLGYMEAFKYFPVTGTAKNLALLRGVLAAEIPWANFGKMQLSMTQKEIFTTQGNLQHSEYNIGPIQSYLSDYFARDVAHTLRLAAHIVQDGDWPSIGYADERDLSTLVHTLDQITPEQRARLQLVVDVGQELLESEQVLSMSTQYLSDLARIYRAENHQGVKQLKREITNRVNGLLVEKLREKVGLR